MHTYPIHTPIYMTSQDINLLEQATGSVIFGTRNRTLVTIDPRNFSKFSSMWNSYRSCLTHHNPVQAIRAWRKSLQEEITQ